MKPAALGLALLALALTLSACADTATLVYCLAVDGNINLKCQ
jgi:predicted small secreted protein